MDKIWIDNYPPYAHTLLLNTILYILFIIMVSGKISKLKNGQQLDVPPIWLMRQAGRYLPEYMNVRNSVSDFLELCYTPEKAAKVTLQPIERYDFDAAIIFADILLVAEALGSKLEFIKNEGPVLSQILEDNDIKNITVDHKNMNLRQIGNTISIVKANLSKEKDLIGFAGAPWTVATYMVEGRGKHKFETIKSMIYKNPKLLDLLIELIVEQTISYLKMQIDAGVTVVKIFDSWAGVVPGMNEFYHYVIKPTQKIIKEIREYNKDIAIIAFPKDASYMYDNFIDEVDTDIIAFDSKVPLSKAQEWQNNVIVQGNLDPCVLFGNKEQIKYKIDEIMDALSGGPFIFNLGHGILPGTPVDNVQFLVDTIRNYGK